MNNREISEILGRDPRARRVFRGVFPRDKLPLNINNNNNNASAYIINTGHSSGQGEHWVCAWFDGISGEAEYLSLIHI